MRGIIKAVSNDEVRATQRGTRGRSWINLDVEDKVVDALIQDVDSDRDGISVITEKGVIVTFPASNVRNSSRRSRGVRAIMLSKDDRVVGFV